MGDGQVLPTLNGAELVVDLSSGIVIDGIGSDATVLLPNIDAGDSVVHVIDAVLLPFSTGAEEPVEEPAEEESIAEVASDVSDLSILVEAVVAAGLLDAVADPEAELTVFAPTNDAFVELLGALGLDGLDDVPVDLLQEVLLYHVVPAVAFSTDLTDGQVLPTLNGAELVVDLSSGIVIDGIGSDATVLLPNIDAGDSVVHVIDAVLLPFSTDAEEPVEEPAEEESIASVARGAEDLSILGEAVVAAGLLDAVADPEAEFTVFAPTNDAFVELHGALGIDELADIDTDTLTSVLLYHIVPAVAYSTDLTDGQVLPTLNGADLVVDLSSGVMIDGIGSDASVTIADIPAANSVVHVIDTVLLPF